MKVNKCLVLAVLVTSLSFVFPVDAQRGVRSRVLPKLPDRHPVLYNIRTLYAFVISENPDLKKTELSTRLEAEAEQKLTEGGFQIGKKIDFENRPVPYEIPELRIYVEFLKLENTKQCVIYMKSSLAKTIFLTNRGNLFTKANLWDSNAVMEAIPLGDVSELETKLSEMVASQVDNFINAYKAAIKDMSQTASEEEKASIDDNTQEDVTEPATETAAEQADEQSAEVNYVSSKNSKIFHKSTCFVVKSIRESNKVTYSTREEAVRNGGIPCSRCKP